MQQQIALDIYPQRKTDKPGFIEKLGSRLFHDSLQRLKNNRLSFQAFARMVKKEQLRIDVVDAQALSAEINQLRLQLKRDGLKARLVARCFALVSAVADQQLGISLHDGQILGGWAMLHSMVAEMKPGEGKTLMATLPACTAALAGIPVHIITLSDYHATHDAELMTPLYAALGLTVGVSSTTHEPEQRRESYRSDITYCNNKQLAFDHLRDRLILKKYSGQLALRLATIDQTDPLHEDFMLPGLCFALVDDADSVLIDQAITPLIVTRAVDSGNKREVLQHALSLAQQLDHPADYEVNESAQNIELSASGSIHLAELTGNAKGLWRNSRYREDLVLQALKAQRLFKPDQHYRVIDGRIEISPQTAEAAMNTPAWDRGMQQMLEVKEGCEISGEQETLGRISYQRLFQRYLMMGGMSGNISQLANELKSVYQLDVMSLRPAQKSRRKRYRARILPSQEQKWAAIVERISEIRQAGRPVLIGTRSQADSALLAQMLADTGINPLLLNPEQNDEQAASLALVGQAGQVTIATELCAQGTDIRPGPGVEAAGGLHVILAERYEIGRLDRYFHQLSARRGTAGSYETITSIQDELVIQYSPHWSLTATEIAWKILPMLARPLSLYLSARAQKSAEKKQLNARRMVLRSEEYLDNVLAFTGLRE